jgi:hypothetical protein
MREPTKSEIKARGDAMLAGARAHQARQEGFRDYDEKVLSIPAFQAHPLWNEADFDIMIADHRVLKKVGDGSWQQIAVQALNVNGKIFIKTKKEGPNTITTVVKWFEKNHPNEVTRILGAAS